VEKQTFIDADSMLTQGLRIPYEISPEPLEHPQTDDLHLAKQSSYIHHTNTSNLPEYHNSNRDNLKLGLKAYSSEKSLAAASVFGKLVLRSGNRAYRTAEVTNETSCRCYRSRVGLNLASQRYSYSLPEYRSQFPNLSVGNTDG
jgi:hypothetical protein